MESLFEKHTILQGFMTSFIQVKVTDSSVCLTDSNRMAKIFAWKESLVLKPRIIQ